MRLVLVLVLALPFLSGCRRTPSGSRPWNSLIVTMGNVGPAQLSSLAAAGTPFLARACLFERCIAPHANQGQAVASLFTALYPPGHGVTEYQSPLAEGAQIWPEAFAERGIPSFVRIAAEAHGAVPAVVARFRSLDRTPADVDWTLALDRELEKILASRTKQPNARWVLWLHCPEEPDRLGGFLEQLSARLEAHGASQKTAVVVAGLPAKGQNIMPGLAIFVPTLAEHPVPRPVDVPVSLCDIGPTLIELAAVRMNNPDFGQYPRDGHSLVAGLLEMNVSRPPVIMMGLGDGGSSIFAIEPQRIMRVDAGGAALLTDEKSRAVEDTAAHTRLRSAIDAVLAE